MSNKPKHPVQQIAEIIEQEAEKHQGTVFPWTLSAAKRILKEVDNWVAISPDSDLPQPQQNVLAWNDIRKEPVLATFAPGGLPFDVWNEGWDHLNQITHWQPLPNPPQQ